MHQQIPPTVTHTDPLTQFTHFLLDHGSVCGPDSLHVMIYDHREYKCYSLLSGFKGEYEGEKHGKIKLSSSSWIDICVIISLTTVFKTGAFEQKKRRIQLCQINIPLLNGVMEHFKKSPLVPQPPCSV